MKMGNSLDPQRLTIGFNSESKWATGRNSYLPLAAATLFICISQQHQNLLPRAPILAQMFLPMVFCLQSRKASHLGHLCWHHSLVRPLGTLKLIKTIFFLLLFGLCINLVPRSRQRVHLRTKQQRGCHRPPHGGHWSPAGVTGVTYAI